MFICAMFNTKQILAMSFMWSLVLYCNLYFFKNYTVYKVATKANGAIKKLESWFKFDKLAP